MNCRWRRAQRSCPMVKNRPFCRKSVWTPLDIVGNGKVLWEDTLKPVIINQVMSCIPPLLADQGWYLGSVINFYLILINYIRTAEKEVRIKAWSRSCRPIRLFIRVPANSKKNSEPTANIIHSGWKWICMKILTSAWRICSRSLNWYEEVVQCSQSDRALPLQLLPQECRSPTSAN